MHSSVLLFLNIGSSEMILIVFAALLLFGGEKLPEIAKGLGKGIRDFKDASEGVKREINNQINSYEEKKTDEALDKQAEVQAQLPESSATLPVVENTMPVSDYHYSATDQLEKPASELKSEITQEPLTPVSHEPVVETAHEAVLTARNEPVAETVHEVVAVTPSANPYHVPGFTHIGEIMPAEPVADHHISEATETTETIKHN